MLYVAISLRSFHRVPKLLYVRYSPMLTLSAGSAAQDLLGGQDTMLSARLVLSACCD